MATGLNFFKDIQFNLEGGSEMEAVTETTGDYYPVHDSCDKEGDPEEKCVLTDALYYKGFIPFRGHFIHIKLTHEDQVVIDQKVPTFHESSYYCSTSNDDELFLFLHLICSTFCSLECAENGGYWNRKSKICYVTTYLNSLCYRVNNVNQVWQLDQPPYDPD